MATILHLQVPSSYYFCPNRALINPNFFNNGKFSNKKYNPVSNFSSFRVSAIKEKKTEEIKNPSPAEDITKKYGLEAGLWKIFSSKEGEGEGEENGEKKKKKSKGEEAKELLAKYGGAYLATSITLSLISFTVCYALINAGVDVSGLLQKIGISTNETGEKLGTFALAYAAHKAASPIRFPPTVALTPIVASFIGNKIHLHK